MKNTQKGKIFEDTKHAIHLLFDDLSQKNYEEIMTNDCFLTLSTHFELFKVSIEKSSASLSRLWMSYLDLTDTILNMIYAQRTGNWQLHLHTSL